MHQLEISTLKILEESGLNSGHHVLAVSGGRDSMTLMHVMAALKNRRRWTFEVVHVHHGGASPYRQKASDAVREQALLLGFDFREIKSPIAIRSDESSLRRFRMEALSEFSSVLFAHHGRDLLETRLIRLIRGTGPQGLQAMKVSAGWKVRPWLELWPDRLDAYIASKKAQGAPVIWVEDPTNSDPRHIRNWIRAEWIPSLEAQRKGSEKRLAASLGSLVESDDARVWTEVVSEASIHRLPLRLLSSSDKRRALALYLRRMEIPNYGLSHIDEILKRLDTAQKEFTFSCLGREWLVDAQHIRLG